MYLYVPLRIALIFQAIFCVAVARDENISPSVALLRAGREEGERLLGDQQNDARFLRVRSVEQQQRAQQQRLVQRLKVKKDPIGEGGYGKVYIADDGTSVLKILKDKTNMDDFEHEAKMNDVVCPPNQACISPFIVKYLGVQDGYYEENGNKEVIGRGLTFELYNCGELRTCITNTEHRIDDESASNLKIRLVKSLVSSVSSMSENGMIHRDLKNQNVFVNTDEDFGKWKFGVADFGISQLYKPGDIAGLEKFQQLPDEGQPTSFSPHMVPWMTSPDKIRDMPEIRIGANSADHFCNQRAGNCGPITGSRMPLTSFDMFTIASTLLQLCAQTYRDDDNVPETWVEGRDCLTAVYEGYDSARFRREDDGTNLILEVASFVMTPMKCERAKGKDDRFGSVSVPMWFCRKPKKLYDLRFEDLEVIVDGYKESARSKAEQGLEGNDDLEAWFAANHAAQDTFHTPVSAPKETEVASPACMQCGDLTRISSCRSVPDDKRCDQYCTGTGVFNNGGFYACGNNKAGQCRHGKFDETSGIPDAGLKCCASTCVKPKTRR